MPNEVALASVPLFSTLPKRTLTKLGRAIRERRYKPGETIVRQGDKATEFFIIEKGKVEILSGKGRKMTKITS